MSDITPIIPPAPTTSVHTVFIMPRPGQPGSMLFDGNNVTEFLDNWDLNCEDYELTDVQKCTRLPNYCTPEIKDVVKLLNGYISRDWSVLRKELKDFYWQHDKPRNTTTELYKLIKEAPSMSLNVYLLKYTAITNDLVKQGALSALD